MKFPRPKTGCRMTRLDSVPKFEQISCRAAVHRDLKRNREFAG